MCPNANPALLADPRRREGHCGLAAVGDNSGGGRFFWRAPASVQWGALALVLACLPVGAAETAFAAVPGVVHVIRLEGAIGPAAASYVARATQAAGAARAQCLIVELDTPGGLLDSTKAIVQAFYAAEVPVVIFVSPTGANAGSAGCIITLAADVAAMAPHTSIGAAHPVELGSPGGGASDTIMAKKLENFTSSYVEAIAEKRHRNVAWSIAAVRESASITAETALASHVIDVIARDVPDLLRQIDRREVGGRTMRTLGATVERLPMLIRERVFQTLWRPEVMFILMLIAIYGIIGELGNPGAILPGVAGAVALVLVLYMASVLPVTTAGLALIGLAIGLFVVDLFAATHGILTAGGIVAFFLGSLLLFDGAGPAYRLPVALILPATVVTTLFLGGVVGAGLRAQKLPVRAGRETLLGQTVPALTAINATSGWVVIEGETWGARSVVPIEAGQAVEVVAAHGLVLQVVATPLEVLCKQNSGSISSPG
ncbi:MAG: nodulation protein NfeD [Verrucomicrobia bacterium]|nr:nodulation protein NfeD [Verrucomicrobiota bacterium]